jgi:hypothetical protein
MLDLELAGGVLVDGQRVDHAHGVALTQSLELGDDLAVELGLLEAQHDGLDGSDRHRLISNRSAWRRRGAPARRPGSSIRRRHRASSVLGDLASHCVTRRSPVRPGDGEAQITRTA